MMTGSDILKFVVQTMGATLEKPVKIGNAEYWIESYRGQRNLVCSIPASQIDPDSFSKDLKDLVEAIASLPVIPA